MLLLSLPVWAKQYYISPTGADANPGTSRLPLRTIQHAADVVKPGDTVIVNDGVYTGKNSGAVVTLNLGGSSGAWITFKSANKWGAKIDGRNTAVDGIRVRVEPAYIRIQDFEIYGTSNPASGGATGITAAGSGSYLDIVGNNIHDIGRICTDSTQGQDGIFLATHDVTIENNLIHHIGRFAPGENSCKPATAYYQNHDHGVYVHGANNITIRNNVFYNNKRGWSIQVYPDPVDNLSILNNTFAFPNPWRTGHIIIAVPIRNSRIVNNVFYQPKTAAISFDPIDGKLPTTDILSITNNISTSAMTELYASSSRKLTTNPDIPGVSYLHNQEHTDALLVSPSAYDFRLSRGSPAIGAGLALNDVTSDYTGITRAKPPSIGAYERPGFDVDRVI